MKVWVAILLVMWAGMTWAGRRMLDLSGEGWTCDGVPVVVPHTWNAKDACDGPGGKIDTRRPGDSAWSRSSYVRKRAVYVRDLPPPQAGKRYFLKCEGASVISDVAVNGVNLGRHVGAFTAFAFELTDVLTNGVNRLEIAVDNRPNELTQPMSADFSVYGGLYRKVWLIETDPICIDPLTDGADGVRVSADSAAGVVHIDVSVLGGTNEVQTFAVPGFRLWTPECPSLYDRVIRISQGGFSDEVPIRFAFRTMEFRADGFYLNGVRRQLRGVNRHQDREGMGWAVSPADEEEDIRLIKEMGADALRTAHYPQSRHIYDLCDELGLVCWVEYPNVNKIAFTETFEENQRRQLREMIAQLRNHPSIAMWSLWNELEMNENPEGWLLDPERTRGWLVRQRDYLHALDPVRPIVAATDKPKSRLVNDVTDQLAYNRYPRWYSPLTMREMLAEMFAADDRRILGMSEYGIGASVRQHADPGLPVSPDAPWHPEEYQAFRLHDNLLEMTREPRLWGHFVWAMFDFGADCRTEGDRFGLNDKGLVAYDHRTKKDAFYLYQAAWQKKIPVLHLVGSRMESVGTNRTTVVAFSNVGEVSLTVNGLSFGGKEPDVCAATVWNDVVLRPGANRIEIHAGEMVRQTVWRVEK